MKSIVARRSCLVMLGVGPLIILFGYFQFHPAQAYPLEPTQIRAALAALTLFPVPITAAPVSTMTSAPGLRAPVPMTPVESATATRPAPTAWPTTEAAPASVAPAAANPAQLSLSDFSRQVAGGSPGVLSGLYVPGIMALRIVPQPGGNTAYISTENGTATQFQKANAFGAIGLLAHNTLSGSLFFNIRLGQNVALVYGDGRVTHYQVTEIADYQRLTEADLRSDFLQLDTNQRWTADQIFARFYGNSSRLTLQTCIQRGEMADWGVHFVVADPTRP